jgi:hypothetical protein
MIGENLPMLPPPVPLETVPVHKALSKASRALAELKGYADTIPNKRTIVYYKQFERLVNGKAGLFIS